MWKKFFTLFLFILFSTTASSYPILEWELIETKEGSKQKASSLIINGTFSKGLKGWNFVSNPQLPSGYNKVYIQNGAVIIHSHCAGNGGEGYLYQDFPFTMPHYFKVDYDELQGNTCESIFVALTKGSGPFDFSSVVFLYRVGGQDIAPNYAYSYFCGQVYKHAINDHSYEHGTVELRFQYEKMAAELIINGRLEITFKIPSIERVKVNRVLVGAINNCCDGRNDAIGRFDNIVLY